MYHLYLLHCADNTLYTGITTDLARRVTEHNTAKLGAKYTRGRRPVKLVYSEAYPDKSSALKAEYRLKRLPRAEKMRYAQ
jgi:putative endonuclease